MPRSVLPEVKSSSAIVGESAADLFGGPIKIAGNAGDQQAALFGQTCFAEGLAKNTYGTGCFMLMNVGTKRACFAPQVACNSRLERARPHRVCPRRQRLHRRCRGAMAARWIEDWSNLPPTSSRWRPACLIRAASILFPHSPDWERRIGTNTPGAPSPASREERPQPTSPVPRLESIAYQVADILDIMQNDAQVHIRELRVGRRRLRQ